MKRRILKAAAVYAAAGAVLLGYYFFVRLTGRGIPCIFRSITGLKCPGCGNTRAVMALSYFEVKKAAGYNLFIFPELMFIGYAAVYVTVGYIRTGSYKAMLRPAWLMWGFLGLLVIWGIVRNVM